MRSRHSSYTRGMIRLVSAVAAGAGFALAFPTTGWWWLAVPAVAVFLAGVRTAGSRGGAAAVGAGFGLAFFGLLFPWLAELGWIAFVPLWILESSFFVVLAAVLWSARRTSGWIWGLVAAGMWGVAEWIRARFPLGGFPWGNLAFPLGEAAGFRNAAQWVGASGLSVVGAWLAAGSVEAWRGRRIGPVAAPAALVLALTLAGSLSPAVPDGQPVRVAIVQGSTPCPGTHCPDERLITYRTHLELTRSLEPGSVHLVVWPEGSTGGFAADPILVPEVGAEMAAEAARLGAALVAGGDRPVSDTEWINANVIFGPDGTLVGEYRKRHPVPFGEYVPARPLFGWVKELEAVPRDMIRGDGPLVVDLGFGPFGTVISFEGAFARYARETVAEGAGLLVVATNQGSYPYSPASDQFIWMTRMRAAESGVDVVHAAVTGRSTLITDGGRIGETTPLAEPALLVGTVRMRDAGPTLYVRWGDWFVWAVSAAGGAAWYLSRNTNSERGSLPRNGEAARAAASASRSW